MVTVDANIILRLVLGDNAEMARIVKKQLVTNTFLIKREVLSEILYVLSKTYKIERKIVVESIYRILDLDDVIVESENVVKCALKTYKNHNLDFVDCMLYAYQEIESESVFAFDKKLLKLLG
jgi:predicted nucleic-acid-binding protein